MSNITPELKAQNRPLYSLIAAIALLIIVVVAVILVPPHREDLLVLIVGGVLTTIPSLIASVYAERTSRDVRNGVLTQKAREGATKALQDTGVTDVVDASQRGAATLAAITALSHLTESDKQKRDALALLLHPKTTDDAPPATDA